MSKVPHASDCATNNAPALPVGPCDCWLDPTPEMLQDPRFEAIWQVIKSWDVNVPHAYQGYCGATGNHVRAILDALSGEPSPVETSARPFVRGYCCGGRSDPPMLIIQVPAGFPLEVNCDYEIRRAGSSEETSPPHPGPSIEKAFAQSPRRIPGPNHNCDAMGCPSIGPHILESHGRLPGIDRAEDPPEKASAEQVGGWLCSCGGFNTAYDGPCKSCGLPAGIDPVADGPELL